MIQSADLQIGNFLLHSTLGVVKVVGIHKGHYIVAKDEKLESQLDNFGCKGIPVSEEWMLKLGFVRSDEKMYSIPIEMHETMSKKATLSLLISFYYGCNAGIIDHYFERNEAYLLPLQYPYVHQIQNLYYQLTRNHLTVDWSLIHKDFADRSDTFGNI